jgi:hypothetical protein
LPRVGFIKRVGVLQSADSRLPLGGAIKRVGALKSADFSHLPRVGANKTGGALQSADSHLPSVGAVKRGGALKSAYFSHLPRGKGVVALCSFVSPYEKDRELARQLHKGIPHFKYAALRMGFKSFNPFFR